MFICSFISLFIKSSCTCIYYATSFVGTDLVHNVMKGSALSAVGHRNKLDSAAAWVAGPSTMSRMASSGRRGERLQPSSFYSAAGC